MKYTPKSPSEEIEEIELHIARLKEDFLRIKDYAKKNSDVYSKIKYFYDKQIERLEEMRLGKLEQFSPDLNPPRVPQGSNTSLAHILESHSESLDRNLDCKSGYYIGH